MTLEERVRQRKRTTNNHRRVSQHLHKLLRDLEMTPGNTTEEVGVLSHLILNVLALDSDLLVQVGWS
jgi:hypothetical protein